MQLSFGGEIVNVACSLVRVVGAAGLVGFGSGNKKPRTERCGAVACGLASGLAPIARYCYSGLDARLGSH